MRADMKPLLQSMTWPEVNDAVLARRVLVLPVAAIEQHGPHLPVDTDNLNVIHIVEQAATRSPDVLVAAPPIHYGYNEHNMEFPGTVSVRMENLLNYYYDVGESYARMGFGRIVLFNGHGSNVAIAELAARRITVHTSALAASISWWDLILDEIQRVCHLDQRAVDHACEWETSAYLHIRPELVQMDKAVDEIALDCGGPGWMYSQIASPAPVRFMNWWSRYSATGVNGKPSLANAEAGKVMVEAAIERLTRIAAEFRDAPELERRDLRAKPDLGIRPTS
jgi:creatinine amidohydrolase